MTTYIVPLPGNREARVTIMRGNSTGFPACGIITDADAYTVTETPTVIYGGYCHAEIVNKISMQMLDSIAPDGTPEMDWSDLEPAIADAGLECHCEDTE